MMLSVAERLTDHWDRELAAGRPVDVPGDMTKLTLETISRTGFGHDFGSFERDRPHPFVTSMVGTLSYAQRLNSVPSPLAPLLLRTATRRNEADIAYLNNTVDAMVRTRRDSGGGDGDLLDRMLDTTHPDTGERLSPRTSAVRSSPSWSPATRRPPVPCPSRSTTSPATRRSRPAPAPRSTRCGATRRPRLRPGRQAALCPPGPRRVAAALADGPRVRPGGHPGHRVDRNPPDAPGRLGAYPDADAAPRPRGVGPGRRGVRPGPLRRQGPYAPAPRTPSNRSAPEHGPASAANSPCTRRRWSWACCCAATSCAPTRRTGCA